MAKKTKKGSGKPVETLDAKTHILGAGEVVNQPITDTLELNFMPYAMSVIMSRAIPEIDGFKPSHRKILFTMYKMGLLTGNRSKSANIVGRTMQLNPHGDAAIYETMVRLSKGYEALLHPYVDSKGNFGKAYSRDMMWAASRYTEAKLDKICTELFSDIDKDTVDFVDNYDNTMKEPVLLPVTYPSVLVNANTGIAAGMASSICSFNLEEVCNTTIELLRNPKHDVTETLKGPDFSGGGFLVYKRDEIESIYRTGRGGFKVRAKYTYDKSNNCIDVTEIPPTTTSEAIIDRIIEKIKAGSIKEISDIRDETDKNGLKITIDIKKGTDPDKLMKKLYDSTPLQDTFSCNFNVLINGMPKVLGVSELLNEWIDFRSNCIRRRTAFDLKRASDRLHLLRGLEKILLDIDKAIKIIRNTEEESEVVPNLMIGFKIDKIQAEYVAEIRLRQLNRNYILKRIEEKDNLIKEIAELEDILKNDKKVKKIIISELENVIKKYAKPRRTQVVYESVMDVEEEQEETIPSYPVNIFVTQQGYVKKITPQSLRMSGEHKLKADDFITQHIETANDIDLLFFTSKQQVYKCKAAVFEDTKTSVLGEYAPAKLGMDEGEEVVKVVHTKDYKGFVLFSFDNGKATKVPLSAYETKTNRKKLINAYSDKAKLVSIISSEENIDVAFITSVNRALVVNTSQISEKTTKNSAGIQVQTLKKNQYIKTVKPAAEAQFANPAKYKTKNIPAAGSFLKEEDIAQQLTL